jgi:hypothetical protein
MRAMARRRAWTLGVTGVAAIAAATALWVVPAFSGGTAGEWTWVSGQVFTDNLPDNGTGVMAAYNGSSGPQSVTVRAIDPDGSTPAPTTAATVTIDPGKTASWSWDCTSGFGCARVFELRAQSPDVVPSLIFDEVGTTNLTYAGLVPPSGFVVFGPDQSSTAATTQAISGATAALQVKTDDLQAKTAALQDDTAKLKADTTELQDGNAALQASSAKLSKTAKKLKKQLKKVLQAVR